MSCVFCDIVARLVPASVVAETDDVLAFADLFPVNPGHLLVITKAHAVGLEDLDPATGPELFRVAHQLAGAIRRTDLRPDGINLFLADGEAAFQDVFHIHLHVIPRYRGDRFQLDSGQSTTPTARPDLDDVAGRIRAAM